MRVGCVGFKGDLSHFNIVCRLTRGMEHILSSHAVISHHSPRVAATLGGQEGMVLGACEMDGSTPSESGYWLGEKEDSVRTGNEPVYCSGKSKEAVCDPRRSCVVS
jgi:hypothetical protein